jgi:hypothetical protein
VKILIACEFSGIVRDAFIAKGHQATSCDFLPPETQGPHYQGDVTKILGDGWDMMIAHPPCTYLAVSGLHWNHRVAGRSQKTEEALAFVRTLMAAPIERICLENPVSCISSRIRKPDQIIHPWMFGEDASKTTCLWLKNLPKLTPTNIIKKERYANQTPSGQNKLGPSPTRAMERSRTYLGIAQAMADQWGGPHE